MILDPIMMVLCCPLRNSKCVKNRGFYKRQASLQKCEDNFSAEMDIVNIFRKVRDSYSMLRYINKGNSKKYIKYNKNNVIYLSDSADSSCSSSDESQNNYFHESAIDIGEPSFKDVGNEESFKVAIENSIIRGLPLSQNKKQKLLNNQILTVSKLRP